MIEFNVSVIITVFNKEEFIEQAVKSALNQVEVKEILLIEDGSTDHSFSICKNLTLTSDKIKFMPHADKKNHGASESKNLGIKSASCDYIAFLDADDYYLENRFRYTREIFKDHPQIDGVYEIIELHRDYPIKNGEIEDLGIKSFISPENLFTALLLKGFWFSGDGLTVKKSIFEKTGLFSKNLHVSEDTSMWLKMAAVGSLIPGESNEPVAKYRKLPQSLSRSHDYSYYTKLMYLDLVLWALGNKYVSRSRRLLLMERYLEHVTENKAGKIKKIKKINEIVKLLWINFRFIKVIFDKIFHKKLLKTN